MNKEHKTLLRKNRVALVEDLEPRPVLNSLYQEGILSENDLELLRSLATRREKVEKILDTLPRRGPSAFEAFYKALLYNQEHLAFLLKCNIPIQETASPKSSSDLPTLPKNTSPENPPATHQPSSSSNPTDSINQTEGFHLGLDIAPRPPISTTKEKVASPEGDTYPMNSQPHGLCLIINNASFEAESGLSNRKGSNIDARNLQSLFLFLRYKVKLVENQRARNLKETVFKFAKEDHKNYDSVVVCLLSHGLEGQIYGVDGSLVSINDLVSMFNGNSAKTLVGKPKLFFVQACRGGEFDRGIGFERVDGLESAPSDERPVEEVLEELYASEQTDSGFVSPQSLPSEADFLLAFSTVPGFVSWRHSDKGSWFVQALVDVFKQYSSKEDIANMLIRINRKVALEFESTDKKKQMPAPVIMLTRKVFFFPQS
ncbi:hypothetical protein QZH41_013737 [Actinostola sp. cb2023]|nr:hypothetical protein QZH41_013737 [Actinostola sp. cb2023]